MVRLTGIDTEIQNHVLLKGSVLQSVTARLTGMASSVLVHVTQTFPLLIQLWYCEADGYKSVSYTHLTLPTITKV